MDYRPPGSSVHGISRARTLEWFAISSFKGSSRPRDWTYISCGSCISGQILYHCCCCSVTKSCLTLWDPRDCSTPDCSALHHLPEFAQVHVHWIRDAIQPSNPLSPSSPLSHTYKKDTVVMLVKCNNLHPKMWKAERWSPKVYNF